VPPKSANTDSWAEAFRLAICTKETDPVPDDFFTAAQWANKLDLSLSHTRRLLLEGMKTGKMERKNFRAAFGKIVRREPHYRLLVKT